MIPYVERGSWGANEMHLSQSPEPQEPTRQPATATVLPSHLRLGPGSPLPSTGVSAK